MKIVLYTSVLSPHLLPLVRALRSSKLVPDVVYVYTQAQRGERTQLGWACDSPDWVVRCFTADERVRVARLIEDCDLLLLDLLDAWIMQRIEGRQIPICYMSERWFKPPLGFGRIFSPFFWERIRWIRRLFRRSDFVYLAVGIYAAQDMMRLLQICEGQFRFLFRRQVAEFLERKPCADLRFHVGRSSLENAFEKIKLWGYFVDVSEKDASLKNNNDSSVVNILWGGRLLHWKRIDSLVKAVIELLDNGFQICLRIVGTGPQTEKVRQLAGRWLLSDRKEFISSRSGIFLMPAVSIEKMRDLMRMSDIYVLPSNGYEGWGVVVNESMGEGCCVLASREAGSAGTLIEDGVTGLLFNSGDVGAMAACIRRALCFEIRSSIGLQAQNFINTYWSPAAAANSLMVWYAGRGYE